MALPQQRLDHLSFKGNRKQTRYGWLRLTPAYSLQLIGELLDASAKGRSSAHVLDPFCGTGTTALVCAEKGIPCDTTDINPFLVWLARAKCYPYTRVQIVEFRASAELIAARISAAADPAWAPPLHQIEKWWDASTLAALGRAACAIQDATVDEHVRDMLKVAFCQMMIKRANVSFGHQSMSFKKPTAPANLSLLLESQDVDVQETRRVWMEAVLVLAGGAASAIRVQPTVSLTDARQLQRLKSGKYSCVVTSPPYPNRMSYIRELRPYMYWLRYLEDARTAGEMDWQAIGGTWGCATSNVGKWAPPEARPIPHDGFDGVLAAIAETSPLLSRYVHKYFYDMVEHCQNVFRVVAPGGQIHYVVGNSKFYDVMLPVEEIFKSLFTASGFVNAEVRAIRKRSSKKELFEFIVSASKP